MQNTCKTNNPNYYHVDSDFDISTPQDYYWSLSMISMYDDRRYDCDIEYCDHDQCTAIDSYIIDRAAKLLFPELEPYSYFSIWASEYTGIDSSAESSSDDPMPVYALGL